MNTNEKSRIHLQQKPLVSVLVPVFGVEKYIDRCVTSLFQQTYKNLEFIFVDDGTKDNSMLILEKVIKNYPEINNSIKIIKHSVNKGIGFTRETALNAAIGEYIIFIDSDDYVDSNMVELMINEALKNNADMIFCNIIKEYETGIAEIVENIFNQNKLEIINSSFSQPSLCNKLIKTAVIRNNNLTFNPEIHYGEDLAFTPRVIYFCNQFAHIEAPLYHYVIRNAESYTVSYTAFHLDQTLKVIGELVTFFNSLPDKNNYAYSLNLLKAIRKAKIIRSGIFENKCIILFPELKFSYIKMNIDLKSKVILLLASLRFRFLLKFFVRILLAKKR